MQVEKNKAGKEDKGVQGSLRYKCCEMCTHTHTLIYSEMTQT